MLFEDLLAVVNRLADKIVLLSKEIESIADLKQEYKEKEDKSIQ